MAARPGDRERPQPKREDAPPPDPKRSRTPRELPGDEDQPDRYEDPVDESSADSMITSDPPARSGVRLGPAKRKRRG